MKSIEILETSSIYDMMQRISSQTYHQYKVSVRLTRENMHELRDKKRAAIRNNETFFDIRIKGHNFRINIR